jgi:hypothetical protein
MRDYADYPSTSSPHLFAPSRWAWHQHFTLDRDATSRSHAIQDPGLLRMS